MEEFVRLITLIGEDGFNKLKNSKIAVVGLGGVGGYVVEGLARSGVGSLVLVDGDVVAESNINRQIIALHSTIGRSKAELWGERVRDINPECEVDVRFAMYTPDAPMDFSDCDYVVDAIDTVPAKTKLISECYHGDIRIISSMGTGSKIDANFSVSDIFSVTYDPLARKLRKNLRNEGVEKLKVVYSSEENKALCQDETGKRVPGTVVYSPCIAGMLIVKEVIKDITGR